MGHCYVIFRVQTHSHCHWMAHAIRLVGWQKHVKSFFFFFFNADRCACVPAGCECCHLAGWQVVHGQTNIPQRLTCVLTCGCCIMSIESLSAKQKKRTDLGNTVMRTSPVVAKAPPIVSGTQMKGFLIACSASDMHKHTNLTVAVCCSIICNKDSCQVK